MTIGVKITGDKDLMRKLGKLGDVTGGRLLETAVVAGALLVQNAGMEKARVKTGNMRRSIHIGGHSEKSELANSTGTDVGGNGASATGAHVLVGSNVDYLAAHEFGTSKITAQPMLRPALDEQAEAVRREIGEALKDLILRAAR